MFVLAATSCKISRAGEGEWRLLEGWKCRGSCGAGCPGAASCCSSLVPLGVVRDVGTLVPWGRHGIHPDHTALVSTPWCTASHALLATTL